MQAGGVRTYGLGVTTMEDVFLRAAEEVVDVPAGGGGDGKADGSAGGGDDGYVAVPASAPGEPGLKATATWRRPTRRATCRTHMAALVAKRCQYARRDWRAALCQVLVPVAMVAGGLGLLQVAIPTELPDYVISTSQLNADLAANPNVPTTPNCAPALAYKAAGTASVASPEVASLLAAIPQVNVSTPLSVRLSPAAVAGIPDTFGFRTDTAAPVGEEEALATWLLAARAARAGSTYNAWAFTAAGTVVADADPVALNLNATPGGVSPQLTYVVMCNTSALHGAPLGMNLVNAAALRAAGGGAGSGITVRNHPLPYSAQQSQLLTSYMTGSVATIMLIAYAFIPAALATYVVRERELGVKHQHVLAGVRTATYWAAAAAYDTAVYLPTAGACIALFAAFDVRDYMSPADHRLHAIIALLALYGWAIVPYTYVVSHLFSSHTAAQNSVLLLNIAVVLLMIVSMIMGQALTDASLCAADRGLRYVWRIGFPGFNLGNGMYALAFLPILPSLNANCDRAHGVEVAAVLAPYDALDFAATGTNLVVLAVQGAVFWALVLALDDTSPARHALRRGAVATRRGWARLRAAFCRRGARPAATVGVEEDVIPPAVEAAAAQGLDSDVAEERRRIYNGSAPHDADLVLLRNVWKAYAGKLAVRGLHLGLQRGTVFVFLGVNGGGKTTTLSMVTGALPPSLGSVTVCGSTALTRQDVGYCPQVRVHALHLLLCLVCRAIHHATPPPPSPPTHRRTRYSIT